MEANSNQRASKSVTSYILALFRIEQQGENTVQSACFPILSVNITRLQMASVRPSPHKSEIS